MGDDTDDESCEGMLELMDQDPRVHFWNLPRQELPDEPGVRWGLIGLEARNHGHDQATGEYVGGLDDDDEFTTDHVEVLVRAIEWNEVDLAYGRSRKFHPAGGDILIGTKDFGYANLCDGAAIWKRELGYRYDPAGPLERGLPEDGDLWERMKADGVRTFFVAQVVHHYYPNPEGFSV